MFSQISDDELGLKDGKAGDDKGSEENILPIQGERERGLEWVVKKEVSYSVKVEVEETGEEKRDVENRYARAGNPYG